MPLASTRSGSNADSLSGCGENSPSLLSTLLKRGLKGNGATWRAEDDEVILDVVVVVVEVDCVDEVAGVGGAAASEVVAAVPSSSLLLPLSSASDCGATRCLLALLLVLLPFVVSPLAEARVPRRVRVVGGIVANKSS